MKYFVWVVQDGWTYPFKAIALVLIFIGAAIMCVGILFFERSTRTIGFRSAFRTMFRHAPELTYCDERQCCIVCDGCACPCHATIARKQP